MGIGYDDFFVGGFVRFLFGFLVDFGDWDGFKKIKKIKK